MKLNKNLLSKKLLLAVTSIALSSAVLIGCVLDDAKHYSDNECIAKNSGGMEFFCEKGAEFAYSEASHVKDFNDGKITDDQLAQLDSDAKSDCANAYNALAHPLKLKACADGVSYFKTYLETHR